MDKKYIYETPKSIVETSQYDNRPKKRLETFVSAVCVVVGVIFGFLSSVSLVLGLEGYIKQFSGASLYLHARLTLPLVLFWIYALLSIYLIRRGYRFGKGKGWSLPTRYGPSFMFPISFPLLGTLVICIISGIARFLVGS